jgi:hypothetical protein
MSLDGVEMTAGNDSQWHALATLDDVGPGQMIAREVGDIRLALYNVGGRSSRPTMSAPMLMPC